MVRFLIPLLLIPWTALALDVNVTVPTASETRFAATCDIIIRDGRLAENTTDDECAAELIKRSMRQTLSRNAETLASRTVRRAAQDERNAVNLEFGSATRRAVCGDGNLDTRAGEVCDDGAGNSRTVADACRTNCRPATCGDGVVDTGEVCDDETTCADDCQGTR